MDEPLWMARYELAGFAQAALPMGCGIRTYHAGDEWHWLYIIRRANPEKRYKNAAFQHAFSSHIGELNRRLLFLVNHHGKDIGSAAAWPDDTWQDRRTGMLYKIMLLPEAREKGLGAPLACAALKRMHQSGQDRAYVQSTEGEAGLYASLGFQPLLRESSEKKKWDKIRAGLPWPEDMEYAPIAEKDWVRQVTKKQMA